MLFYNSSEVYEGEWSEDCRSGWGRMYYENGDIYEGEWMKDTNNGQGIFLFGKRTLLYKHFLSKRDSILVEYRDKILSSTFQLVSKQMEIGMKAAGEMVRSTVMESSTILTKASFLKAFGWMEKQNVGLCLILGGMKHQHQQSIQFHRYIILTVDTAHCTTKHFCNTLLWIKI